MIIAILLVWGLCFGSFVNALVWRIHKQSKAGKKNKDKYSISKGRSMCVDCGHILSAKDLVPIFSWMSQKGKCRYCKKPISWQYPVVEVATALLFVASYVFWPNEFGGWETLSFAIWLSALVGLIALFVYDLRWMLLPNRVVFPLIWVGIASVSISVLQEKSIMPVVDAGLAVLVGGGLFYVLFQVSNGKWIGGGDVKLGFVLGLLVGLPLQTALMLFIASILGTIVTIPLLATKKVGPKTRIPFGPFLITATIIVCLFGHDIADWYLHSFLVIG